MRGNVSECGKKCVISRFTRMLWPKRFVIPWPNHPWIVKDEPPNAAARQC
jgi:hypothetical protein